MPWYFFDSSALVKAYRREEGTQRVIDFLASPDLLVVARLAHVEVTSAIVRRGREAGVPPEAWAVALEQLDRDIAQSFGIVELSPSVLMRAVSLSRVHRLRAADAIQLACALQAREEEGQPFTLVGSDQELNSAAAAEGFAVIDPAAS
jgi:predicted nucleic acid-binding protein